MATIEWCRDIEILAVRLREKDGDRMKEKCHAINLVLAERLKQLRRDFRRRQRAAYELERAMELNGSKT